MSKLYSVCHYLCKSIISNRRSTTDELLTLLQYWILFCCIRPWETRCILSAMLYLRRMCQCGLHAAIWPHIGILMCLLAALHNLGVPQGLDSLSVSLSNDLYDPAFDGVGLMGFKASAFLFAEAARSLFVFYWFSFLFVLSIGWHCGHGVFRLI